MVVLYIIGAALTFYSGFRIYRAQAVWGYKLGALVSTAFYLFLMIFAALHL